VGQAGAGQDEVVGFEDFGLAEFGQQVQVVAEALQLLEGFFRQVVAGRARCREVRMCISRPRRRACAPMAPSAWAQRIHQVDGGWYLNNEWSGCSHLLMACRNQAARKYPPAERELFTLCLRAFSAPMNSGK